MKILEQGLLLIALLLALIFLSYALTHRLSRNVGARWLYYFLLAPGTILHELCHAAMSLLLLVPVREVHLFRVRQESDERVQLGEVVHDDVGPVRNLLIGIAPLAGASLLIYFLSVWLLPGGESWQFLLRSGWTYLFLTLVFFIALGLSPSRQDLKALPGFVVVAAVLGLAGYLLVRLIASRYDLSGVENSVASALRTVNMGLLLVLAVVAVVVAVIAGGLYLGRRW